MMKKSKCYLLGILALLCLMPTKVFAQNLTVEGSVKDETGEPLIGVTIMVQGQGTGSITDFDGNFSIQNVRQGATLEFSYVGYLSQTHRARAGRMDIVMQPDTKTLEEVVVIAYGERRRVAEVACGEREQRVAG